MEPIYQFCGFDLSGKPIIFVTEKVFDNVYKTERIEFEPPHKRQNDEDKIPHQINE